MVLLSVEEMYRADRAAMDGGVPGPRLMAAAGWAVAREVRRRFPRAPVAILCGPGNNGGDGFVAARLLARAGWPVRVALLGRRESLGGDAAWAAARWQGPVDPLSLAALDRAGVVIDALFGAGLARPLDGEAAAVVAEINRRGLPVVAVDVPSGVHGDSGAIVGEHAIRATATVTFFRRKPGHLLLPGRALCGPVTVADIGIPASVLDDIRPRTFANGPDLWTLPQPRPEGHKYRRGHALVVGGGQMTGAGRLAARAARRVGAGMLTVAAPAEAVPLYAGDAPGTIVAAVAGAEALKTLLAARRFDAVLLGPGGGVGAALKKAVLAVLATGSPCVLDADALTSFADDAAALFGALRAACVLTPHDGECARLFGPLPGSRLERARAAARQSGAVVLLKGPDTVIAAPDGRAAINDNAPPDLATAGAGDVLAGMIAGLLAQGMEAFAAASAAAWLHGLAATRIGAGLIAEDLPEALPAILAERRIPPHAHLPGRRVLV